MLAWMVVLKFDSLSDMFAISHVGGNTYLRGENIVITSYLARLVVFVCGGSTFMRTAIERASDNFLPSRYATGPQNILEWVPYFIAIFIIVCSAIFFVMAYVLVAILLNSLAKFSDCIFFLVKHALPSLGNFCMTTLTYGMTAVQSFWRTVAVKFSNLYDFFFVVTGIVQAFVPLSTSSLIAQSTDESDTRGPRRSPMRACNTLKSKQNTD